jgi:hypothetical protein
LSIEILPESISKSLKSSFVRVDFPLPVLPTRATFCHALISKLRFFITSSLSAWYLKSTFLKEIFPSIFESSSPVSFIISCSSESNSS